MLPCGRGALLLLLASWAAPLEAFNEPAPPPPPPSPPGIACSGEQILTSSSGSISLTFGASDDREALDCTFLLYTAEAGLIVNLTHFELASNATGVCSSTEGNLTAYDGTTAMAKMLAQYSCSGWAVGSHTGAVLLHLYAAPVMVGTVEIEWRPSDHTCGNGVCEGSADEYDLCPADCDPATREGQLPPISEQWADKKWCPDFDRLKASTPSGEETTIPYTVAHYGPGIPLDGMVVDVGVTDPYDACSAVQSVSLGGNVSTYVTAMGLSFAGTAYLSSIYSCHFIYKTIYAEAFGAALEVVANAQDNLFYMAAAEERQPDALALDIPSILIGRTGRDWITQRLAAGVVLEIGADQVRCAGARLLTATSGHLQTGPPGQKYCANHRCGFHIALPVADVVVVTFRRFNLECMTRPSGEPYDALKVYDGATTRAPLLHTFSCTSSATVVSTGRHLLLEFAADDVFNFDGFEALYASAEHYCALHDACGTCAADPACAWCLSSHECRPASGPQATCAAGGWAAAAALDGSGGLASNASMCCPVGWSGVACDVCAPGHYGADCASCGCGPGSTCSDGLAGSGTCVCADGWAGTKCDACLPGHWGDDCAPCDCAGGSTCDDGRNGTGCLCLAAHYGVTCAACACVGEAICNEGMGGTGSCSCPAGAVGPDTGCTTCEPDRYGADCLPCDCPAGTACDAGYNGTGDCSCTGPLCEGDASLSFLHVVVTERYQLPGAPSLHLPFGAAFSPATHDYGSVAIPDAALGLHLLLASTQWGARVEVALTRDGSTTIACNETLGPHANGTAAMALASATTALGPASHAGGSLATLLPPSGHRLIVACAAVPRFGVTEGRVVVTSVDRTASATYTFALNRTASDDCRLDALALRRPDGTPLAVAPTPDFAADALRYTAVVDEADGGLLVHANTSHATRCGGRFDGVVCVSPALVGVRNATDVLLAPQAGTLAGVVGAGVGRTPVEVFVVPESRAAGAQCAYEVSISRGEIGFTEHRLRVSLTASGNVDDVPPDAIRSALASAAGVSAALVRVYLASASVSVEAHVGFASAAAASAASAALAAGPLASASAATALFAPFHALSVVSAPVLATSAEPLITSVEVRIAQSAVAYPSTVLAVGPLAPAAGATIGAATTQLFPTGGNLSLSLAHDVTAVTLAPEFAIGASIGVECRTCDALEVGTTAAVLTLTAQDGVHQAVVTLLLERAPSSDCSLDALAFSGGPAADGDGHAAFAELSAAAGTTPAAGTPFSLAPPNTALYLSLRARPTHAAASLRYQVRTGSPFSATTHCGDPGTACSALAADAASSIVAAAQPARPTHVLVTAVAQDGTTCSYTGGLTRPRSSDTSLAPAGVGANVIVSQQISSALPVTASCGGAEPSGADSCWSIALSNAQRDVLFKATANHSVFCEQAAHACLSAATLSMSAPTLEWEYYNDESGDRGVIEAVMSATVGTHAITLTAIAEDAAVGSHTVFLTRAADNLAELLALTLTNAAQRSSFYASRAAGVFVADMNAGRNMLGVVAALPSGASLTVDGAASPTTFEQRMVATETTLALVVVAEDGVTSTAYELVVHCGHCSESFVESDNTAAAPGGGDGSLTFLGSSFWLMLVLLVAATTLCSLSLLVCVRMQFIRAAQRRALRAHQRRNPPLPVLSEQQLLARLAPFLHHRKGVPADVQDDTCAICLGELEDDEECTELGCHHHFHKECIHGWLVHKGLAAPCPLCKRLVAPSLVSSVIRQQQAATAGGGRAAAAAIEMQDLAAPAREVAPPSPPLGSAASAGGSPRPQEQQQQQQAVNAVDAVSAAADEAYGTPRPQAAGSRAMTPEAWAARPTDGGDVALSVGSASPTNSASSSGRSTPRQGQSRASGFGRRGAGARIAPATPSEVAAVSATIREAAGPEARDGGDGGGGDDDEGSDGDAPAHVPVLEQVAQFIVNSLTPETSPANSARGPATAPAATSPQRETRTEAREDVPEA